MPVDELPRLDPVYRAVRLEKRRGGWRRLHVPDNRTKEFQRRLLRRVLDRLRVHPSARGFTRGRSIVHNALPHVGQRVVINMDVVDFFPSTSASRVEAYFRRIGWNRKAPALLTRMTTCENGLPQGAPTSPLLSNLVNYAIDERLARLARRRGGQYTRYADDITFSFPRDYPRRARGTVQRTRRILKAYGYRLHRREKLHIRRRHQGQLVTGLVVNQAVNLPRHLCRRLRAVEHHLHTGRPATMTSAQLNGWKALLVMIQKQSRS